MANLLLELLLLLLLLGPQRCAGYPGTCSRARAEGFTCADERVVTADGFVLEVHHILPSGGGPGGGVAAPPRPRRVALLQHGLVDSSLSWVANSRAQSLPFLLADRGYDVWVANSRGREPLLHTNLSATDARFWEWTWDEMASHDLPATVAHVMARSAPDSGQLVYIGHSQGSTLGFAAFHGALAETVGLMVALGPVGLLQHSIDIVGVLKNLLDLLCGVGSKRWGPRAKECDEGLWAAAHALLPKLCAVGAVPGFDVCVDVICEAAGCTSHGEYNRTTFPSLVLGDSCESATDSSFAYRLAAGPC